MAQDVFYSGLNEFCQKYLVEGRPLSKLDHMYAPMAMQAQKDAVFEHLMLFDKVTFKVYGENILIPVLLGMFGQKGFDSLVEQKAISFALWTPTIVSVVENVPGLEGIAAGSLSSPEHSDPERSIESGLRWSNRTYTKKEVRRLVKKVRDLYEVPDDNLSSDAVKTVRSALLSGRLREYGLEPEKIKLDALSAKEKSKITRCAEDLLEYRFLVQRGKTSFSEYKYFSPFWDTIGKFMQAKEIKDGFWQIAEIEGFPDLKAISDNIEDPLKKLPRLRQTRNARRFRAWMDGNVAEQSDPDFIRSYVDAIADRKGLFDNPAIKFSKSVAMTGIGAGVGALAGGPLGAAVGAATGGVVGAGAIEALANLSIDVLDSFVLESITKGWTPKMFFNQITKLQDNEKTR